MLVYLFCCKQNCKSRRAGVLHTYGISKERCSAQRKHSHAKRHTNSGGRMRNAHGKLSLSVWAAGQGWEKPWSTSKVWRGDGPRNGSCCKIRQKAYMFSEDAEAEERERLGQPQDLAAVFGGAGTSLPAWVFICLLCARQKSQKLMQMQYLMANVCYMDEL